MIFVIFLFEGQLGKIQEERDQEEQNFKENGQQVKNFHCTQCDFLNGGGLKNVTPVADY